MLSRLFKTTNKALECSQEQRKLLLEEYRSTLQEFVYTINQVQDIQAIENITEPEKEEMRNSIIDNARTETVSKIIELDNLLRKSNSNKNFNK